MYDSTILEASIKRAKHYLIILEDNIRLLYMKKHFPINIYDSVKVLKRKNVHLVLIICFIQKSA